MMATQPGAIGRRCRAPASFRKEEGGAVPVFDRMTSRRGFIRAAAAAGTTTAAAASAPAPAAATSRATVPAIDPIGAAIGPDALLVALEREVLDVHARLAALRDNGGNARRTPEEEAERDRLIEPLCLQLDDLLHQIGTTPAATLTGAAVKLRRLCCRNLGIADDLCDHHAASLRHILAIVETATATAPAP